METLTKIQKPEWLTKYDKPLIIAGPCSAESEKQVMTIAESLDKDYVQVYRAGIWKPRTKPNCFEGVGAIGLNWLKKVKDELGMLTSTEVANANHVKLALEFDIDILWIGARTTVNPFVVQEIAEALRDTKKVVLVKNPVNPDLDLWIGGMERLQGQGIHNLGAIHRGFSTYKKTKYRNRPQWQIALDFMNKMPDIPMICDPSHIMGKRDGIFEVSQQAFNFEYDGLMIETHNDPDNAWSDASQQVTPARLLEILKDLEIRSQESNDESYQKVLQAYRKEIDEADNHIMDTIAERMKVAKNIGELKKQHNIAVFQPNRWEEISANLRHHGSQLGLSEEFVEVLLKSVHQESIRIQNDIMTKK